MNKQQRVQNRVNARLLASNSRGTPGQPMEVKVDDSTPVKVREQSPAVRKVDLAT